MNKANRFRQRNLTQVDNYPRDTAKTFVDENENQFYPLMDNSFQFKSRFTFQSDALSRLSSIGKRVQTQPAQIEPFRQISNFHLNRQNVKSFIKTKPAKLYPKTVHSNRQTQPIQQIVKESQKFGSNFEILKRQIQQLESMQILKAQISQSNNQSNPQNHENQPFHKTITPSETFYPKMTLMGEFAQGKNVSILEKKRQNIKKVLKNKKFRNYINPHKNINDYFCKNLQQSQQQPSKQQQIVSFLSLNKTDKCPTQNNSKNQSYTRKKQTPPIIKKYYRPQSCCTKKYTPTKKQNKLKIQLSNYISLNSISIQSDKHSLSKLQVPSYLKAESSKNQKKNKSLVIVCL